MALNRALIANCELQNFELDAPVVSDLVEYFFGPSEEESAGSPHQHWYRRVATGTDAVVDDALAANGLFEKSRLIAWKTGKPFRPENLFFRTVDSGRLLPMHLADFRVQFYAHKSLFEKIDKTPNGREEWAGHILRDYMHKILAMRNMHDKGGADIPILITSWCPGRTKMAMDYWVDLSKGDWSEEERIKRYDECSSFCYGFLPCFFQMDLLVRALLSDPKVDYVPPFIMFHSVLPRGRTCVLFTKPRHVPPPALVRDWPGGPCRDPKCPRADCVTLDMEASRCLVADSAMVRQSPVVLPKPRMLCNLWGCDVEHTEDSEVKLQRCQRCREVLYCSSAHQTLDWGTHKNVCEKRG